jgi:hypothetical protein
MGVNFVVIAFLQNITVTPTYGQTFLLSNLFLTLIVAILCFKSAIGYKPLILGGNVSINSEDIQKEIPNPSNSFPKWRWWGILLAIFAVWSPADQNGNMAFPIDYIIYSDFGMAFCFTIPVYMFILTLFYPTGDIVSFRGMAVIGLYFGIMNIIGPLSIPGYPLWMVVLHLPLFIISAYALILQKITSDEKK